MSPTKNHLSYKPKMIVIWQLTILTLSFSAVYYFLVVHKV